MRFLSVCFASWFVFFMAAQGICVATAFSVSEALSVLSKTNNSLIVKIEHELPTVLSTLRHVHRPFMEKARSFIGRAALGYAALVLFAIANDQFTARASKEYFSEGFHKNNMDNFAPRLRLWLAEKDSSTLWAVAWGVLAGNQLAQFAGPLLSAVSALSNAPPLPMKTMIIMMLIAIGVTAAATGYAYHNADKIYDCVRSDRNGCERVEFLDNACKSWDVDDSACAAMGQSGQEQYYRVAVAHGTLYGVGQPSILALLALTIAARIYMQCKFKKEKKVARQLLPEVVVTDENRDALSVLQKALA